MRTHRLQKNPDVTLLRASLSAPMENQMLQNSNADALINVKEKSRIFFCFNFESRWKEGGQPSSACTFSYYWPSFQLNP